MKNTYIRQPRDISQHVGCESKFGTIYSNYNRGSASAQSKRNIESQGFVKRRHIVKRANYPWGRGLSPCMLL